MISDDWNPMLTDHPAPRGFRVLRLGECSYYVVPDGPSCATPASAVVQWIGCESGFDDAMVMLRRVRGILAAPGLWQIRVEAALAELALIPEGDALTPTEPPPGSPIPFGTKL